MALIAAMSAARAAVFAEPLVTPDGDEARRWAEEELSNPAYAAAEPNAFDRLARGLSDFLGSLFTGDIPEGLGSAFLVIAAVVIAGLLVAGVVIWGVPRARPPARVATAELFGEAESRSAAQLRRDAAAAVAREGWDEAIVLRFRALARGVAERGLIHPAPGATVHAFARAAGRPFPAQASELEAAAAAFDDVRYLRRPGTAAVYARVAAVDEAIAAARPAEQVAVTQVPA